MAGFFSFKTLKQNADAMAVSIFMFAVFLYVMFWGHSDLPPHAGGAKDMLEDGHLFAGNFLICKRC